MAMTLGEFTFAPYGQPSSAWTAWAENIPTSRSMGLRCVSITTGHAVVELTKCDWPLTPSGAVHGGMVLAWADHCLGIVGSTAVSRGQAPATATVSARFLRPAIPPLTFEATVQRTGRTLQFVQVEVRSSDGRVAALVEGTMVVDGTSRHVQPAESSPATVLPPRGVQDDAG
jgi:uncharacterized protein (TIGR00369 family)